MHYFAEKRLSDSLATYGATLPIVYNLSLSVFLPCWRINVFISVLIDRLWSQLYERSGKRSGIDRWPVSGQRRCGQRD